MVLHKDLRVYSRPALSQSSPLRVVVENRQLKQAYTYQCGCIYNSIPEELEDVHMEPFVKVMDAYGMLGTLTLDTSSYLLLVTEIRSVGKFLKSEVFSIVNTQFVQIDGNTGNIAPPIHQSASPSNYRRSAKKTVEEQESLLEDIRKICNDTTFYFATENYDLTRCFQKQLDVNGCVDQRFDWNMSLRNDMRSRGGPHDDTAWVLSVIRGFIGFTTSYVGAQRATAAIFARLSKARTGARFQIRGVDEDGNVANEVETEQVIIIGDAVVSFVQIRGSVPVYWEQPGIQIKEHKLRLSRGRECSVPAFDAHLKRQQRLYGSVVLVNLLSQRAGSGELMLSDEFAAHTKRFLAEGKTVPGTEVQIVVFDFHVAVKGNKFENLSALVDVDVGEKLLQRFGIFQSRNNVMIRQQLGTLRTNCLDCLDRTNVVQGLFARRVLKHQLLALNLDIGKYLDRFLEIFKIIWADHGDFISWLYAGTGALKSGFTRTGKRTVSGLMDDGAKSVKRFVQNNFKDSSKQEAIDIFLGKREFESQFTLRRAQGYCSYGDSDNDNMQMRSVVDNHVLQKMTEEKHLYSQQCNITVFVGTWNVNGGKRVGMEDLTPWLFPTGQPSPDIFVIGFQELVDLTASNVMSTDDTHKFAWENEILKCLTAHPSGEYVPLASEQLVGVCLYVFVRSELVPTVRGLATDTEKVGMHGLAGNKGAVAMRFFINDSSMCFVCAHLAAGQSNVCDRNEDYHDITRSINFSQAPYGIVGHEYVIWLGDFNYRLDLSYEEAIHASMEKDWSHLSKVDQLRTQQASSRCFNGFSEGTLNFAPTYKYDNMSDVYDTSEKRRIPSWTDRILWHAADRDAPSPLINYTRAELLSSDHRPVIAHFCIPTFIVNIKGEADARERALISARDLGTTVVALFLENLAGFMPSGDAVRATASVYGNVVAFYSNGPGHFLITFDDIATANDVSSRPLRVHGVNGKTSLFSRDKLDLSSRRQSLSSQPVYSARSSISDHSIGNRSNQKIFLEPASPLSRSASPKPARPTSPVSFRPVSPKSHEFPTRPSPQPGVNPPKRPPMPAQLVGSAPRKDNMVPPRPPPVSINRTNSSPHGSGHTNFVSPTVDMLLGNNDSTFIDTSTGLSPTPVPFPSTTPFGKGLTPSPQPYQRDVFDMDPLFTSCSDSTTPLMSSHEKGTPKLPSSPIIAAPKIDDPFGMGAFMPQK